MAVPIDSMATINPARTFEKWQDVKSVLSQQVPKRSRKSCSDTLIRGRIRALEVLDLTGMMRKSEIWPVSYPARPSQEGLMSYEVNTDTPKMKLSAQARLSAPNHQQCVEEVLNPPVDEKSARRMATAPTGGPLKVNVRMLPAAAKANVLQVKERVDVRVSRREKVPRTKLAI
jgi:hypothetical protein